MSLHFIQRGAHNVGAGLADIKRAAAGNLFDAGAEGAAGGHKAARVGIGVGGDKARAAGDEKGGLMHHLPVERARLADDHEIGINVGNGKARFIEFMDQRAFANHVGLFAFLTTQEIGGRHRGGIKHRVGHLDAGVGEAVRQILRGLRRIVGQHHQRHLFLQDALQKLLRAGHGGVVVH